MSRNPLTTTNTVNEDGNPTGGTVYGMGLSICWQNGPLGDPPGEPNGAFVDDVIEAALQRLQFYQTSAGGKFACRENALAITKLEEAMHWLQHRQQDRIDRGVQGTYEP